LQLYTRESVTLVKWKLFPILRLVNLIVLLCMLQCAHLKVNCLHPDVTAILPTQYHLQAVAVHPSELGGVALLFLQTEIQVLAGSPSLVVLGRLVAQPLFHSVWTLL
jgi:hypothetical protein